MRREAEIVQIENAALAQMLASSGGVTREDMCTFLGCANRTLTERLRSLVNAGVNVRILVSRPALYVVEDDSFMKVQ
jgi:hypothetical protein